MITKMLFFCSQIIFLAFFLNVFIISIYFLITNQTLPLHCWFCFVSPNLFKYFSIEFLQAPNIIKIWFKKNKFSPQCTIWIVEAKVVQCSSVLTFIIANRLSWAALFLILYTVSLGFIWNFNILACSKLSIHLKLSCTCICILTWLKTKLLYQVGPGGLLHCTHRLDRAWWSFTLYTPCYSMYIFTDGNKTDTIYYTSSTDYNPVTDQLPLVNAVLTDSRLVHHILSWCEVAAQCNVSG